MPSLLHEAIITAFRSTPELAARVLRELLGVEIPNFDTVRTDSETFTAPLPVQRTADLVVRFEKEGKSVFATVLEIQLEKDETKPLSTLLEQTLASITFKCPACVLVITPTKSIADWLSMPFDYGPGTRHQTFVLGPGAIPFPRAPIDPAMPPEFTVLGVLAHGRTRNKKAAADLAAAALAALTITDRVDPHLTLIYYDAMTMALSRAARAALEDLMKPEKQAFRNPITEKILAIGRAEGEARGLAEGEARGLAEGEARGLAEGRAEALLLVLEARGLRVSPSQRARIEACTNATQMERWVRRAVSVSSTDELFESDS